MAILIGAVLSLLWLAYNAHEHISPTGQWRYLDLALCVLAFLVALVVEGLHAEKQKLKKMGKR